MATGIDHPARKNSAADSIRLACSQNAIEVIRASEVDRGAPVSLSIRTAETTSAAVMMTTATERPSSWATTAPR
jgi:hypothetical protein